MYRHLLPKVPEAPVGDLDRVSVEQGVEDVTGRDGGVEDLEELGPDTAGYPGIPRRIKPPDLPLPAPGFSFFILVIERVDVFLLIFKVKRVATGLEGFLIFRLAFIEHFLITRQNIESVIDISFFRSRFIWCQTNDMSFPRELDGKFMILIETNSQN